MPNFVASAGDRAAVTLPLGAAGDARFAYLLEFDIRPVFAAGAQAQSWQITVNGAAIADELIALPGRTKLGYVLDAGLLSGAALEISLRFADALLPAETGAAESGGAETGAAETGAAETGATETGAAETGAAETGAADGTRGGVHLFGISILSGPRHQGGPARVWPPSLPGLADDISIQPASAALLALVRDKSGMTAETLALRFESLGQNCEFGLVQRRLGAEPIGLLRFSSTMLFSLLAGLDCAFDDAADLDSLSLKIFGETVREYYLLHKKYSFLMHTGRFADRIDEPSALAEMHRSMQFMQRKFAETLALADRIFVYQSNKPLAHSSVRPILARLRRYGPNRLLWVHVDASHPPGSVIDWGDGLLEGFTNYLAPGERFGQTNLPVWASMCINALRAAQG